jgi:hypothetical protein
MLWDGLDRSGGPDRHEDGRFHRAMRKEHGGASGGAACFMDLEGERHWVDCNGRYGLNLLTRIFSGQPSCVPSDL